MTRYHTTLNGNIPFTAEEETARDIEEQAWADGEDASVTTLQLTPLIIVRLGLL